MSEKKTGIFISYASLLSSSLLSILLTPFMLSRLGSVEYGLYQTISSFVGVLTVLDFGSGIATTKYVAEFNLKKDKIGRNNYLAMALVTNAIISMVIVAVGMGFVFSIDTVYASSFTASELEKAKVLAWLYIINIVFTIFVNMLQGVIIGAKKFSFGNGIAFVKILLRYGLMALLLGLGFDSIAISIADIAASLIFIVMAVLYSKFKLDSYPKLKEWDNKLFRTSLTFSSALFLQAIVSQINNSIDKVLLGSLLGGAAVTIYAVAMHIYLIYGSLAGAIRRVMLPDAIKLVSENAGGKKITDFVIEAGRYQFIFLIYILCGFILVGKEFVLVWVGESYSLAYYIAIILMVPTLLVMSSNVTETILDAMGKRMIRSVILVVGSGAKVIITIVLIKEFGVIGAPVGTAVTCVAASLVALNIYHKKVMDLQVKRMFFEICHKTLPCALLAMLPAFAIHLVHLPGIYALAAKGIIFTMAYVLLLWRFGLRPNEKQLVINLIRKRTKG